MKDKILNEKSKLYPTSFHLKEAEKMAMDKIKASGMNYVDVLRVGIEVCLKKIEK